MKKRYFVTAIMLVMPAAVASPARAQLTCLQADTKFDSSRQFCDGYWQTDACWDHGVPTSTMTACIPSGNGADIRGTECLGGSNQGVPCHPDKDCPDGTCDDGVCSEGSRNGQLCDCPDSTCGGDVDVVAEAIVVGGTIKPLAHSSLTLYGHFECVGGSSPPNTECDPEGTDCQGGDTCEEQASEVNGMVWWYGGSELLIANDLTIYGDGGVMRGDPDNESAAPVTIKAAPGSNDPVLTTQGKVARDREQSLVLHEIWTIDVELVNNAYIVADIAHAPPNNFAIILQGAPKRGNGVWRAEKRDGYAAYGELHVECEVEGSAKWELDGPAAKIIIADGATCTNLSGDLTVSDGTFYMSSTFGTTGEIKLDGGRFRVDTAFTSAAFDVTLSGGILDVNENLATTGDLDMTSGSAIEVASGRTAVFDYGTP